MDKKQQQILGMLFAGSFSLLTASHYVPASGSNLMDLTQGILTGLGLVGMLTSVVIFGRHYKRSY